MAVDREAHTDGAAAEHLHDDAEALALHERHDGAAEQPDVLVACCVRLIIFEDERRVRRRVDPSPRRREHLDVRAHDTGQNEASFSRAAARDRASASTRAGARASARAHGSRRTHGRGRE